MAKMSALALALALLLNNAQRGWARRFATCDGSIPGPRTVVLVGGTGGGKSNLGNFLAGENIFVSGGIGASVTKEPSVERRSFFNERSLGMVEIVDTPGLEDTEGMVADQKQWGEVVEKLTTSVKKAHALVLVVGSAAMRRWTTEVRNVVQRLRDSFGQDFWRFLHIFVTSAPLGLDSHKEIQSARDFMLKIEEQLVGKAFVDTAIRDTIAKLPIYRVDMNPIFLDTTQLQRTFKRRRARELMPLSLRKLIQLDQQLNKACSQEHVENFDEWEDEDLEDKLKGRPGMYSWGVLFGKTNLGALEDFRLRLQSSDETMELMPSKLPPDTRRIQLRVQTGSGVIIEEVRFLIAAEMRLAQVLEKSVYTIPIVADLKKRHWLKKEVIFYSGSTALVTDDQFQDEVKQMLEAGDEGASNMTAIVGLKPKTPPAKLDNALLRICFKAGSVGVAESMVSDRLFSEAQLGSIEKGDLEERLPRTMQHGIGNVAENIRKLHEEQVDKVSQAQSNVDMLKKQRQERRALLDDINKTQEELEPYLKELIQEVRARGDEATQAREEAVTKVRALLDKVRNTKFLDVPTQIPNMITNAELKRFVEGLKEDLEAVEDNVPPESRDLGILELIRQSRVLKGMRLSKKLEEMSQDMVQLVVFPDAGSLLTPARRPIGVENLEFRSESAAQWAKQAMEVGGSSFSTSIRVDAAGFIAGGLGALHFATKIRYSREEEKATAKQAMWQTSQYTTTRHHLYPQQLLQLDAQQLRLTDTVLQQIVQVLEEDEVKWPSAIVDVFGRYGTHVCTSAEMGGIWTQEAKFKGSQAFEHQMVTKAMSECLSVDVGGGGSWLGPLGFGSGSVAVQGQTCTSTSEAASEKHVDIAKFTTMSRRCFSNLRRCPASPTTFERGMKFNGNWNVIDRTGCFALWDFVSQAEDDVVAAVLKRGIARIPNRTEASAAVKRFQKVAPKVWRGEELDVQRACEDLQRASKPEGCGKLNDIGYLKMELRDLDKLWEDLSTTTPTTTTTTTTPFSRDCKGRPPLCCSGGWPGLYGQYADDNFVFFEGLPSLGQNDIVVGWSTDKCSVTHDQPFGQGDYGPSSGPGLEVVAPNGKTNSIVVHSGRSNDRQNAEAFCSDLGAANLLGIYVHKVSKPEKLNFAFRGTLTLTFKDKLLTFPDFRLGQGQKGLYNNWWIGSDACKNTNGDLLQCRSLEGDDIEFRGKGSGNFLTSKDNIFEVGYAKSF